MAARITNIFPILLITLLCVGIVEGGYQILERFVLRAPAEKSEISESAATPDKSTVKGEPQEKFDYRIILQRNLFGPLSGNDRLTTQDPEIDENMKATSLNIVLMGTTIGAEGTDRAIILDKSSHKQDIYESGDAIQGATIKEILRGKVILRYNGQDEMLDMSEAAEERSGSPSQAAGNSFGQNVPSARRTPASGTTRLNPPPIPPARGTPGRVVDRPKIIRPSRSIR